MYFGVSGSGRVLHTINPRLHPDQIAWVANHAEDQVLVFDMSFLPLVQAVHARCPTIRQYVAMCDADKLPKDSGIPNLVSYESWIGGQPTTYTWPSFDENSASSMCYTSGTTGNPKAALYSHRSPSCTPTPRPCQTSCACRRATRCCPWFPCSTSTRGAFRIPLRMVGAKLVFPGPALDGKSVYELIEAEKVNFAAGVPTVWQMLLGHRSPTSCASPRSRAR
jgi:fatty-acyl-CoA synthase